MMGDPKHLSDVLRVNGEVRIACRRSGFEDDWSVDELTRRMVAVVGRIVWSEVTRRLRCRRFGCGSADLHAVVVPYARRAAHMPRRVRELNRQLMALLCEAVRGNRGASATTDGQLALVVHR